MFAAKRGKLEDKIVTVRNYHLSHLLTRRNSLDQHFSLLTREIEKLSEVHSSILLCKCGKRVGTWGTRTSFETCFNLFLLRQLKNHDSSLLVGYRAYMHTTFSRILWQSFSHDLLRPLKSKSFFARMDPDQSQ